MPEKKKTEKETGKDKTPEIRTNIRCRNCFVVDGYRKGEHTCKHCGAKIYAIDGV